MNENNDKRVAERPGTPAAQWTHRQALQLIAMLPDNLTESVAILERARFLLGCWDMRPAEEPDGEVVRMRPKLVGTD